MSEQDAVERLDEIRERAKYLKKYGERELYYYNPQEHKDLFFLLDLLEAQRKSVTDDEWEALVDHARKDSEDLGDWPETKETLNTLGAPFGRSVDEDEV